MLLVNEGLNPKSNKSTKELIVTNTDQIPTVSGDKSLNIKGSNKVDAAIFKKVAA